MRLPLMASHLQLINWGEKIDSMDHLRVFIARVAHIYVGFMWTLQVQVGSHIYVSGIP